MGRRRLLTTLIFFITFSFLSSSYFQSNRLCVNGEPTVSRVCSHAGLVDGDNHTTQTVSKHSLLYLQARGVACFDLDVFWDRNGEFYLGHPRVIQNNYNLSLNQVSLLPTSDFAAVVQNKTQSPVGLSAPLKLSELVEIVNVYKLGPISLELKGREQADYFDRFAQLYTYLAQQVSSTRFALLMFALEDVKEVNSRLSPTIGLSEPDVQLALTLTDTNSSGPLLNISEISSESLSSFGVISASWKLWSASNFAHSLSALKQPVMAWNIDHREYFRFRDLMTSQAVPNYLVSDFPLALVKRLNAECDANPAADDLRSRLENRFFLVWSNALPRSILSY